MAKQKIKVKKKSYSRKTGGNTGYKKCGVCNGTGRIKVK